MSSSGHIHTFWQQGEYCCCLHAHESAAQHFVAVCVNGRPFFTENVADPDEAAKTAERFWTLFVEPQIHGDQHSVEIE